jgi:hypothetical protein
MNSQIACYRWIFHSPWSLMMRLWSKLAGVLLLSLSVTPAIAQQARPGNANTGNADKKGRQVNNPLLKATEKLELTAEQKEKVTALGKEFTTTMVALREKGLTPELTKKKSEAVKAARDSGKKGAEVQEAAMAKLDATAEEKEILKQAAEAQTKLTKGLATVLTKEQIAKLPEQPRQNLTRALPKRNAQRNRPDAS